MADPTADVAAVAEAEGALAGDKDWLEAGSVWAKLAAVRATSMTWARITYFRCMI